MTRVSTRRIATLSLMALAAILLAWQIVAVALAGAVMAQDSPAAARRFWPSIPDAASQMADDAGRAGDYAAAAPLALEALSRDPNDARALHVASLLAYVGGRPALADEIMVLAARLGWRDAGIQRWVLERALYDRQWDSAAHAADALLRTNGDPDMARAAIARIIATPAGRSAVADRIARDAPWALETLRRFDARTPDDRAHLTDLLLLLDGRGALPAGVDAGSGAIDMLNDGQAGRVLALWRELNPKLPGDPGADIVDGGFEYLARATPRGPFGWRVPQRSDATLSFVPHGGPDGDIALLVETDTARTGVALTQLLALRPGDYGLTFDARLDRGEPGDFQVELRCEGRNRVAAPVRVAVTGSGWQRTQAPFSVPAADCPGQTLAILAGGGAAGDTAAAFDALRIDPRR